MADDPSKKEEQATKDLLAGFDRVGRSPRAPPVRRDFVDFHAAPPAPREAETVLVTRARRPVWLPWVVAAFASTALLGIVAGLTGIRAKPRVASSAAAPAQSAPVGTVASNPVAVPAPLASVRSEPTAAPPPARSIATPSARPREEPREEPRVDFVRNL